MSHLRRSGMFALALPSPLRGWANLCRASGADVAMRCTQSLADRPLLLLRPQKRRLDRRTPQGLSSGAEARIDHVSNVGAKAPIPKMQEPASERGRYKGCRFDPLFWLRKYNRLRSFSPAKSAGLQDDTARRRTLSLAGSPLVLPQPQKRRLDRRTPN